MDETLLFGVNLFSSYSKMNMYGLFEYVPRGDTALVDELD